MLIEQVMQAIEKKRDETSEYLVNNCVETNPSDYYKAQGLNDIYSSGLYNVANVKPEFVNKELSGAIGALRGIDSISDIQRQQGRIEALRYVLTLMSGDEK
tara:strand:+ start:98 stop:400 length:303 start_codon:yes stop_codon:yes gene_type:complete